MVKSGYHGPLEIVYVKIKEQGFAYWLPGGIPEEEQQNELDAYNRFIKIL